MKFRKLSIAKQIALSFFLVIFTGSLLLTLPISQLPTSQASYLDNLFLSVSAVCVTGLFTQPIFSSYTTFGQIVIMLMIQIGGLGLMTIISFLLLSTGKKMSFSSTVALSEALNKEGITDIRRFVVSILKYTFIIELVGFVLLATALIPDFGWEQGLFNALFTSISAFCNAGFDNWNASSLISYVHNPIINFTISSLIILGGIGFAVWFDVTQNTRSLLKQSSFSLKKLFKRLKVHTKLALTITFYVILIGTILGLLLEYNNPNSIGQFSLFEKVMTSYFQTVTMRTAGFATVDYTTLHPASNLIYMVTMFIGGSPGGTAGGIKTTTMAIVFLMILSDYRNRNNVNVYNHTVPHNMLRKANIVFVSFLSAFILGSILVLLFDPNAGTLPVMFEVTSALNTVGVSMNLTPSLTRASQAILMILMFGGRIGPMTLLLSLSKDPQGHIENTYSEAKILIG